MTLQTTLFKAELLARHATLQAQLAVLRGGPVGRAEASASHFANSEESPAQASTERDLELALDAHESAELAAVNAALQRIELGTYGHCVDCGESIAEARLKATPDAARCIGCQQASEG